jgi:hypothetical protein
MWSGLAIYERSINERKVSLDALGATASVAQFYPPMTLQATITNIGLAAVVMRLETNERSHRKAIADQFLETMRSYDDFMRNAVGEQERMRYYSIQILRDLIPPEFHLEQVAHGGFILMEIAEHFSDDIASIAVSSLKVGAKTAHGAAAMLPGVATGYSLVMLGCSVSNMDHRSLLHNFIQKTWQEIQIHLLRMNEYNLTHP